MDVIQRLSARRKILDGRELFLTVFGGPQGVRLHGLGLGGDGNHV
jgi:hypothetical protein